MTLLKDENEALLWQYHSDNYIRELNKELINLWNYYTESYVNDGELRYRWISEKKQMEYKQVQDKLEAYKYQNYAPVFAFRKD